MTPTQQHLLRVQQAFGNITSPMEDLCLEALEHLLRIQEARESTPPKEEPNPQKVLNDLVRDMSEKLEEVRKLALAWSESNDPTRLACSNALRVCLGLKKELRHG